MTTQKRVVWKGVVFSGSTWEDLKRAVLQDPRIDSWEALLRRAEDVYGLQLVDLPTERQFCKLHDLGELRILGEKEMP